MYIRKGAERAFLWSLPHNSPAEKTELQLACSEQSHRLVEPNGLQCQSSTRYRIGVPATAAHRLQLGMSLALLTPLRVSLRSCMALCCWSSSLDRSWSRAGDP